jgi:hypothetical protein
VDDDPVEMLGLDEATLYEAHRKVAGDPKLPEDALRIGKVGT